MRQLSFPGMGNPILCPNCNKAMRYARYNVGRHKVVLECRYCETEKDVEYEEFLEAPIYDT